MRGPAHCTRVQAAAKVNADVNAVYLEIFERDERPIGIHVHSIATLAADLEPGYCQISGSLDIDRVLSVCAGWSDDQRPGLSSRSLNYYGYGFGTLDRRVLMRPVSP